MKQEKLISSKELFQRIWKSFTPKLEEKHNKSLKLIEQRPFFVPPQLISKKVQPESPFIIISAPGAVGKSTMAKYCAHEKSGFYWNLAEYDLGDNAFQGMLLNCFGVSQLANVIDNIRNGKIVFFIDAFDEAEILSGWEKIEKFIQEIYTFCKDASAPCFILLSRSETAGNIEAWIDLLDEESRRPCPSFSLYEIEYFAKENAFDFVKNYTRIYRTDKNNGKPIAMPYENHPDTFQRALNSIFKAISSGITNNEGAVWEDSMVRSFIGYSPVLQAIAVFLEENGNNYEEVANKFEGMESALEGVKIIRFFIEKLLEREQNKVIETIKEKGPKPPENWNNWSIIYSPSHQLQIILNFLEGIDPLDQNSLIDPIPDWLAGFYIEAVSNFIPNHPFIKKRAFGSPAFADFTLAELLSNPVTEKRAEISVMQSYKDFTSLFAHFYVEKTKGKSKGTHIGFIYESATSKSGFDQNLLFTFIKPEDNNRYIVEIVHSDKLSKLDIKLDCLISDEYPLFFPHKLLNANIQVDSKVKLGKNRGIVKLNNLNLRVKELEIDAKELVVETFDGTNSIIFAKKAKNLDPRVKIRCLGKGVFNVNWPGAKSFPWSEFAVDSSHVEEDEMDRELIFDLLRILVPFRKHGRNDFAKHCDFIDNVIVGGSTQRQNLLTMLRDKKIVTKSATDHQYHLSTEDLSELGATWANLNALSTNPNLDSFLREFKENYL